MVVHIQHAPMHLRKVSARFFSKGQQEQEQEEEGAIISHLELSGTPSIISEDQPSHSQSALKTSELRLSERRSLLMRSLASTG